MEAIEVPPATTVDFETHPSQEKSETGSQAFRSFLSAAMDDKDQGSHYMLENAPPQSEDFVRAFTIMANKYILT